MASTKEEPQPTVHRSLRSKTGARVADEQAVLRVLRQAEESMWTARELRSALVRARHRLARRYGGSWTLWYRAVRTVAGVSVTQLGDSRQLRMPWSPLRPAGRRRRS
ncbi:MAG TPA: hypothetical protein VGI39_17880 [Polyangiaceae bacterium]|jgi:hypothetical protein